ncbi:DUF3883 domain-containing protein [Candidatus Roizmanbacteria bacterium]|nr:DUF3883 domain-containing protein [Candidatus Roizmanbacteria bacterium]
MNQPDPSRTRGSYTANLLGNIKSHLAGLQGYDVMALEFIQNADDAKAEGIVFEIGEAGLTVTNSAQFTYCGDLHERPCKFIQNKNYSCDYHRIVDVGSGGKLLHSENIGRFGIGFVSSYQITDHPEIRSAGIKLILHPESGEWLVNHYNQPNGTSFFLPWASDPESETRLALGVSHVTLSHIEQLAQDLQKVLRTSLLFLRHVRKAEVRRDGKLLLACDLERGNDSELRISFQPGDEVEDWHVLRTNAVKEAEALCESFPILADQDKKPKRSTEISLALRIYPEPIKEGLLYAFLPTEQETGLPVHINADFFPEPDRKALIFAGNQHEQAWNAMLIASAAAMLSRDLECLLLLLGHNYLWKILSRAYEILNSQSHPPCYSKFWAYLKVTAAQTRIVLSQNGSDEYAKDVFLPRTALTNLQVKALKEIGGEIVVEELRPFQTAMNQLGAPILILERLVNLLTQATEKQVGGQNQVTEERLEQFYRPLWSLVNDLIPENTLNNPWVKKLKQIPFLVTEDLYLVTISQSYVSHHSLNAAKVAALLPRLAIVSCKLLEYPRIVRLVKMLDLGEVVSHLSSMIPSEPVENAISVTAYDLRELYDFFSDLDRQKNADIAVYKSLGELPIWLSSKGLITANQALLPGNFNDPTGLGDLLDVSVLTDSARSFVSTRLGVKNLNFDAYVQTVLPKFFTDEGPIDANKYPKLIEELASHPSLIDDKDSMQVLHLLKLIPTMDGNWSDPPNTYRKTDELIKILGNASHLWIDTNRIPNTRSLNSFIDNIGIRWKPKAKHLVDRLLYIANKYLPTEEAKKSSGEAFYFLSDHYDEWKERKDFKESIHLLKEANCFPADDDTEKWYTASDLYAPYRAEAFNSQVYVLGYRNTSRLKTELLKELGISTEPETQIVIDHLLYCVDQGEQPHVFTYQILNERGNKGDLLIEQLKDARCIYHDSLNTFFRPNQCYWTPQQLGCHAITISGSLESFKPLFSALGVKNSPEAKDYVDILMDIVEELFEQAKPVTGIDRTIYDTCLTSIASFDENELLESSDLCRLKEAPTILNQNEQLSYPDELLLQDSEWHAGFFNGELDLALCKFDPELWPFLEKVGVKRLSDCAEVALSFVDGEKIFEEWISAALREKTDIFARLLHDKPTVVRRKVNEALNELKAFSYDILHIQASVNLGGSLVNASVTPAQAYYEIKDQELILVRPVSERSWPHILNAFFHQLMPDESGSEIAKLTLSVRALMMMSNNDAHQELTDAGIPLFNEVSSEKKVDLTSPELKNITGITDADPEKAGMADDIDHEHLKDRTQLVKNQQAEPRAKGVETSSFDPKASDHQQDSGSGENKDNPNSSEIASSKPFIKPSGISGHNSLRSESSYRKSRPKHKEQWDRRLLSYVRKKVERPEGMEDQGTDFEHNLAVEMVARKAVCDYEKDRARDAEQMPQTHPGYDIISRNPITGEERFIEVKGISGEWSQTGVGLSSLQFSNALDYRNMYWLYVVEFISDPKHMRVHPIRSPATQVTTFMFDGNWRDAVTEENTDPTAAFIIGARIKHQNFGIGCIASKEQRGSTQLMIVEFDQGGMRKVPLNLKVMEVIEEDHGEDVS